MKAIMVMFDSLNRRYLPPYGCDWTVMPNFKRLAERTVTLDTSFVGSMPCMPARRELHTGRYNFLHRAWGPLEPFDDSMPEILGGHGIYTHLASDHYHYWEDGGATYHSRYHSWEFFRGQEGDPFIGQVAPPEVPETVGRRPDLNGYRDMFRRDLVNRAFMPTVEDQPQHKTFSAGLDFIERNHEDDNWFLHIETFDPHEPYFTQQKYKDLYPHEYKGKHFDWPPYRAVEETEAEVEHCRLEAAALHSMCDEYLGRVLDAMDRHDLWKDTLLIVNTDHGFLMGEHEYWAKCHCPMYNEIAHTPLFIWDPRVGLAGERRQSLVQTIDLPATILEYFGIERPPDMQGVPLRPVLEDDRKIREGALFGLFGAAVCLTDGEYVYMRGPQTGRNGPLHEYTHMPTRMRHMFSVEDMRNMTVAPPFAFTKGCPVMRLGPFDVDFGSADKLKDNLRTRLFNLRTDPEQRQPLDEPETEERLCALMRELMIANDAPLEQYDRLGLARP